MGLENPMHIAIVVVVLLLLFGARRLPEMGRSLGTGMREFKDAITGSSADPALTAKASTGEAQALAPRQAAAPVLASAAPVSAATEDLSS